MALRSFLYDTTRVGPGRKTLDTYHKKRSGKTYSGGNYPGSVRRAMDRAAADINADIASWEKKLGSNVAPNAT